MIRSSTIGAVLLCATAAVPAAVAAPSSAPTMQVWAGHAVKGHTLTYAIHARGYQHLARSGDSGRPFRDNSPMGTRFLLDDRIIDGSDAGDVSCTTTGRQRLTWDSRPARTTLTRGKHTFKVVLGYCGKKGYAGVTATYRFNVR